MSSYVNPLRSKIRTKASISHMVSFFLSWYHFFFLIFAFFIELNLESKMTMDEHRHKIIEIFMFFLVISQVEKTKTSFIIHKQTH
jgi:hypothetical protein